MLRSLFTSLLVFSATFISAQTPTVLRLYPGPAPGSEGWTQQEAENNNNLFQTRIVYNVATPTLTVFRPAQPNGTGIVICPGGGFHALSIDSEGNDVARWLMARGVTCFVLKYRLVESKTTDPVREMMAKSGKKEFDEDNARVIPLAIADGRAAMRYVRERAAEYGLNPQRIGIIGFSAGGTVATGAALTYAPAERPDFVAPIYPYVGELAKTPVPADAPPLFVLTATNDQLGLGPQSVQLYQDWVKAKKPAELHMMAVGGHGFGMKKQNLVTDGWITLFGDWLGQMGFLKKAL